MEIQNWTRYSFSGGAGIAFQEITSSLWPSLRAHNTHLSGQATLLLWAQALLVRTEFPKQGWARDPPKHGKWARREHWPQKGKRHRRKTFFCLHPCMIKLSPSLGILWSHGTNLNQKKNLKNEVLLQEFSEDSGGKSACRPQEILGSNSKPILSVFKFPSYSGNTRDFDHASLYICIFPISLYNPISFAGFPHRPSWRHTYGGTITTIKIIASTWIATGTGI